MTPDQYPSARQTYADLGVDADAAIDAALSQPISVHCWQADDVHGFEVQEGPVAGGGILATGSYPGAARNAQEVREDLEKVLSLVPGRHRVNLHAIYGEPGERRSRDDVRPEDFAGWADWAEKHGIGLDFNPTYFAHELANSGYTLSHPKPEVRDFWIRHGIASRRIADYLGRRLGSPCVNDHWIPDGAKDHPMDRWSYRARLAESLDRVLKQPMVNCVDAVESKLFGLGSEDFVVGSFEFYSHYALTRNQLLCLDMGHFHPTEQVSDKLASLLQFHDRLLFHLSRPMRWDSDHVVLFNDDLRDVFHELVRGKAMNRAILALDYFDASINRVTAYVIGIRAVRKAILYALLEPFEELQRIELDGRLAEKLALLEDQKTLPFGAVWTELCARANRPPDRTWIDEAETYYRGVADRRT